MKFFSDLKHRALTKKTLLSVGLDPELQRIPERIRNSSSPLLNFNKRIIDATAKYTLCYKLQFAHYGAEGREQELTDTIQYIKTNYPDVQTILDYKRGDIGNTANYYAEEAFLRYEADCVTYSPYMGFDSAEPVLEYKDKGVFFLCKTSNKGSGDFQDLLVAEGGDVPEPLYVKVAKTIQERWNANGNAGIVVGGTYPEILKKLRDAGITLPFLVPGIGAQGGDLNQVLDSGAFGDWTSLVISSSRGIIHKSENEADFEEKAELEAKLIAEATGKAC